MSQKNTPVSVPLLDVSRDNRILRNELLAALTRVFDSGQFIGGPECQQFEKSVADYCQTKFAIGCASGSDALLLALMALDIKSGDEVIVPSFTFFATASCVTRLGATPVFVDVDPATFNIDPQCISAAITSRTKAIIPVHLFGQCCDLDSIQEIAREHGIPIIEDCAQSIGATYKGQASGGIGAIGCFSFYPTKNLGGFGDGGIITTQDADLADRIRLLANHGMRPRYYHQEIGINSRLDSMQAAMLNVKIPHLNRWAQRRAENARQYLLRLDQQDLDGQLILPTTSAESGHVWNQFTIRVGNGQRDTVRQKLSEVGIGTEVYYPIPLHRQACFAYLGYEKGSLPVTERLSTEVLSLPIFPELESVELESVVQNLTGIVRSFETARAA